MKPSPDPQAEWLEADGLGGFASGTVGLVRTRRYHALLLAATTPPTGRLVLVSGCEVTAEPQKESLGNGGARWPDGPIALSSQHYAPDIVHPDGQRFVRAFDVEPWPTWDFELPHGVVVRQEIIAQHGTGIVLVRWSLPNGGTPLTLHVRPLFAGRDYHALMHENGAFRFDAHVQGTAISVRPYDGLPVVVSRINGSYEHSPTWYRQFLYAEEQRRGLDAVEDLASPGVFTFALSHDRPACWILEASPEVPSVRVTIDEVDAMASAMLERERSRRAGFATPIDRAADAYLVRRGRGRTIVAGYPWFTDWGRDTFIALRGLCLATGRLEEARDILLEWAGAVSEGMLPNRFPDGGETPEYNAVDASLWYVIGVHEFLEQAGKMAGVLSAEQRKALERAVSEIVDGYAAGTRFGIHMDEDGLLAAGVSGVQLTWMDARVGDRVITPRVGKPVEVQALWINALSIAGQRDASRRRDAQRATATFEQRFWNPDQGCLFDVVDVDHRRGADDATVRPNQILAVGGLPLALVTGDRARQIVDRVERTLVTPLGLRTLAPDAAEYAPRYSGGPAERDAVYHQGTVWPWLMGPFVEAWVRVRNGTPAARRQARDRFLQPLFEHFNSAGLGHISEIADGEPPHAPKGCPYQAWSLGEVLRLDRNVLAVRMTSRRPARVTNDDGGGSDEDSSSVAPHRHQHSLSAAARLLRG